jgi:hypothetical protein
VSSIKIPSYLNLPSFKYLASWSMPEKFYLFQIITLIDDTPQDAFKTNATRSLETQLPIPTQKSSKTKFIK